MQSTILFKVSNKMIRYNSIKETIQIVAYISIINQEPQYNRRKLNLKNSRLPYKKGTKKRYVTPTYPFIFSPLKTAINAYYILNNNSNIVFAFYIFTTNNPILPRHQRESYPQHAYH